MLNTRNLLGQIVGAVVALSATGASAGGGDAREAPFAWTGFYVGGAVGYSFGNSSVSGFGDALPDVSIGLTGQQGVVTVGYDFRVAPRWIAGVFADYALGSTESAQLVKFSINNQWAIGGRVGALVTPSTLLYASAGYTGAHFEVALEGILPIADANLSGYFVGIGGEQALNRNLSLKIDYRFSDYEDVKAILGADPGTFSDNSVHSLRLGLNWKFH